MDKKSQIQFKKTLICFAILIVVFCLYFVLHSSFVLASYFIILPNVTNPAYNGTLTETTLTITTSSALNSNDYAKINASDNRVFTIPGSSTSLDTFVYVNFTIPSDYTSIIATIMMNTSATTGTVKMAIFNATTSTWTNVASRTGSLTPVNLNYTISGANLNNYVSNNVVKVMAYDSSTASVILRIDYIGLNVSNAVANTCTYTSGNWAVTCSDNCIITSNVDLGGNNITFTGAGYFIVGANITNIKKWDISSGCKIVINSGNRFG